MSETISNGDVIGLCLIGALLSCLFGLVLWMLLDTMENRRTPARLMIAFVTWVMGGLCATFALAALLRILLMVLLS